MFSTATHRDAATGSDHVAKLRFAGDLDDDSSAALPIRSSQESQKWIGHISEIHVDPGKTYETSQEPVKAFDAYAPAKEWRIEPAP